MAEGGCSFSLEDVASVGGNDTIRKLEVAPPKYGPSMVGSGKLGFSFLEVALGDDNGHSVVVSSNDGYEGELMALTGWGR
uniref:Uncharacterized protein n=1 Tax=Oryza sativa subsp. japonica TaxID=39947 RepID=Q2R393_ORYSJ|nr:hypothetical protein LOC_Os11g32730 [Oryza sativa Japonica Group]